MREEKTIHIRVEASKVKYCKEYAKQHKIPFIEWKGTKTDFKGSIFQIYLTGIKNQHEEERARKLAYSVFIGEIIKIGKFMEEVNINRPTSHNLEGIGIDWNELSEIVIASEMGTPIKETPIQEEEKTGVEPYGTLAPLSALLKEDIPPIEWLVDRLMVKGGITIFAGEPKAGKSFLAQTLALCLVEGKPYMDVFETKPCRVLYVDEENGKIFLLNRFKSLVAGKEGQEGLNELVVGINNDVKIDSQGMTNLTAMITEHTPDVVIIDSVVRCMVGDEDRATDVRKVFDNLKQLKALGISILLLHHTTKADSNSVKGIRGSGDWGAMIDVVGMVTIKKRAKQFCLEVVRNRHDQVLDTDNFKFSISGEGEKLELTHEGCISHESQSVVNDFVDAFKQWIQDNKIKVFPTKKAQEIGQSMGFKRLTVVSGLTSMIDDRHINRQKQGFYEVIDPVLLTTEEDFVYNRQTQTDNRQTKSGQ